MSTDDFDMLAELKKAMTTDLGERDRLAKVYVRFLDEVILPRAKRGESSPTAQMAGLMVADFLLAHRGEWLDGLEAATPSGAEFPQRPASPERPSPKSGA